MRPRIPIRKKQVARAGSAAICLLAVTPADAEINPADYITTRTGRIPIVISAPHGGDKLIPGVTERKDRGQLYFETVRDLRTAELAERIAVHLARRLGGPPFVVIARFDRRHIDANRAPADAYTPPGNDGPKAVYHAFHTALANASAEIERTWGAGLLIDIHGQALLPDRIIRGTRNGQTVKHLLGRHGSPSIEGPNSLFGALAKLGYKIAPTGAVGDTVERHFTGGHIVDTHGSAEGGRIDAIQVEVGSNYRNTERLEQTARDIAAAIAVFARTYLTLDEPKPGRR